MQHRNGKTDTRFYLSVNFDFELDSKAVSNSSENMSFDTSVEHIIF